MLGTRTMSKPAGKQVLWRYSLRSLLIATTTFAVCLGLWVESARRQHNTVLELKKLGCAVYYRYETHCDADGNYRVVIEIGPDGSAVMREVRYAPRWLVDKCGIDFFDSAVSVWIRADNKDEALPYLSRLPRLRHVFFPWNSEEDNLRVDMYRDALPNVKVEVVPFIVG